MFFKPLPKVTNVKESQILFTVDLHVPKDQMVCLRINKASDFEEKIKEGVM